MRALIGAVAIIGSLFLVHEGRSQFRSPGSTPASPMGGAGSKGSMFGPPRDASTMFDYLARGRPYFLISETRSFRDPLTVFAKEKGITNEQITREQFTAFYAKMDQYKSAGGGARPMGGPFGGPPASAPGAVAVTAPAAPGMQAGSGQNPLEAIGQWAEADFRRRDQNGDNRLSPDEMSEMLRTQLDRWDADHDGLINVDEYKVYYSARLQMRDGAPAATPSNPLTVLIEEDYDRRPDVLRVGKLPKEMPKWFAEYDTDQDGQVALHEWFKAGKEIDEFKEWDRNDDALITAEEVLYKMKSATKLAGSTGGAPPARPFGGAEMGGRPDSGSRLEGGNRPEGGGRSEGGRPSGFGGGFFKKKG